MLRAVMRCPAHYSVRRRVASTSSREKRTVLWKLPPKPQAIRCLSAISIIKFHQRAAIGAKQFGPTDVCAHRGTGIIDRLVTRCVLSANQLNRKP